MKTLALDDFLIKAVLDRRKTQHRTLVETPENIKEFYTKGAGKWTESKTGEYHDIAYDVLVTDNLGFFLVAGDMGWCGGLPSPHGNKGDKLSLVRCQGMTVSPIIVKITNLRLQRLQDITDQEAKAEGVKKFNNLPSAHRYRQDFRWCLGNPTSNEECFQSPRFAYADYWDKIHDDLRPWDSNPLVWVTYFQRC
jgi:hypothetical protein